MKPNYNKPAAPKMLQKSGKAFWASILEDFELEPFHLELLRHACECLDRIEQAKNYVKKKGFVIPGKQGHRANPALAVEKEQKKLFAQLVRELRLDHEKPNEGPRRPRLPEGR